MKKTTSSKKRFSFKTIKNKAVCLQIRIDRIEKKGSRVQVDIAKAKGRIAPRATVSGIELGETPLEVCVYFPRAVQYLRYVCVYFPSRN